MKAQTDARQRPGRDGLFRGREKQDVFPTAPTGSPHAANARAGWRGPGALPPGKARATRLTAATEEAIAIEALTEA
jgi:hypothetical protein